MKNHPAPVQYTDNALVITITTASPSDTHLQLLNGLATALRQSLLATDQRPADAEAMVPLTDLLQHLLPTADALANCY